MPPAHRHCGRAARPSQPPGLSALSHSTPPPAGDFEAAKGLASIVERVGSLFGEPQQQAAVDGMMARFKASS